MDRRRLILGCALWALVSAVAWPQDNVELDRYGGLKFTQWEATGFFRTHFDGQRWWLVTPEGHPFLSIGVCGVRETGHIARGLGYAPYHRNVMKIYGSVDRWKEAARKRMLAWGFNTAAGWGRSDMGLPWTNVLGFSGRHWLKGLLPDFFSKDFTSHAEKLASKQSRPDDKLLIGYFLDNEMQWNTDWRLGPSLFDHYTSMPADTAGKKALVGFFKDRYPSPSAMAEVWQPAVKTWDELAGATQLTPHMGREDRAATDREAFTRFAARRYFRVCTEALRRADPNHLILGCRFVNWTVPEAVVQACGEYCDVVSLNFYEIGPLGHVVYLAKSAMKVRLISSDHAFRRFYKLTGKPLMITEFGFRAMDSAPPNTYPPPLIAQPTVPTQTDRGRKFEKYVKEWAATNYIVGYHWFCWVDEPKEGRTLDGENGNYGLVDIEDKPYEEFLKIAVPANRAFIRARLPGR
ncbi:MAG: hypothetical protein GXP25_23275 [Planctomycetes bacterium]|nr:hypothetical protein [Planctomycetota bacterium]